MPSPATKLEPDFQASLDALLAIRSGLARLLEELTDIRRAADVERALGLDRPLSWRIFRTATAGDAAEALEHLPTPGQIRRVMIAAKHRGVSPTTCDSVLGSLARFEELIRTVAEDRSTFAALLSGHAHAREGSSALEQRVRRDAFKANAHLWGARCRALAFAAIFQPNGHGSLDGLAARAWIDLYTSRPQPSLLLFSRFKATHKDEPEPEGGTRVFPMEVMRDFADRLPSSPPRQSFPSDDFELQTIDAPDGNQETHIRIRGVGKASRLSLYARMRVDAASTMDSRAGVAHTLCIPAEAIVLDLLVPSGWADPATMGAALHARPNDVNRSAERRPVDRIPIAEEPTMIRGVSSVTPTPDVPRWPDVIGHVLAERGWTGRTFDLFRLRVAYPLLHANVMVDVLPQKH
ncbi:MAG TPA: hypothetical protein VG797_11945 [Phycisphaerales bacterium]|nr:hypothetical protein [Phycisphaerales bacterium]